MINGEKETVIYHFEIYQVFIGAKWDEKRPRLGKFFFDRVCQNRERLPTPS